MKGKWVVLILFLSTHMLWAQTQNQQIWCEYMVNYPFANSFNFESAFNYNTLITSPRWQEASYAGTVEYTVHQRVELLFQTTLQFTNQVESYNTFEIRPTLGTRIFFTPNKRIQTRLLTRVDQRNFKNLETDEWSQVYRPRFRAESIIPINKKTIYQDKLWYAMLDAEALFTTDDVEERFANRFRLRMGGGYRLNYSLRFEFLYMLQKSKSGISDDFESSDNIFRFRIKHYLRKSKPSTAAGTGN
jgi:hypothetical protein